jgi:hypothetical protein
LRGPAQHGRRRRAPGRLLLTRPRSSPSVACGEPPDPPLIDRIFSRRARHHVEYCGADFRLAGLFRERIVAA